MKTKVYLFTLIRITIGIFWTLQLTWKAPPNFGCPDQGFCLWVDKEIHYPLIPLYAQTILQLVKAHVYLFGWFTDLLEVSLGLFIIMGIFIKQAAFIASLWTLNLLIGLANVPGENVWYYVFLLLLNLVYVGLDESNQLTFKQLVKF